MNREWKRKWNENEKENDGSFLVCLLLPFFASSWFGRFYNISSNQCESIHKHIIYLYFCFYFLYLIINKLYIITGSIDIESLGEDKFWFGEKNEMLNENWQKEKSNRKAARKFVNLCIIFGRYREKHSHKWKWFIFYNSFKAVCMSEWGYSHMSYYIMYWRRLI